MSEGNVEAALRLAEDLVAYSGLREKVRLREDQSEYEEAERLIARLDALRSRRSSECDGSDSCQAPIHIHGCFSDKGYCDHPSEHERGSSDTRKAARPEHPGPPDVPGQETCIVCGGFLGDDAYGHHSRMCRCERGNSDTGETFTTQHPPNYPDGAEEGSTDTRLTEALLAFVDLMPYLKPSVPVEVPPPNTINRAEVERRIGAAEDLASAALAAARADAEPEQGEEGR